MANSSVVEFEGPNSCQSGRIVRSLSVGHYYRPRLPKLMLGGMQDREEIGSCLTREERSQNKE